MELTLRSKAPAVREERVLALVAPSTVMRDVAGRVQVVLRVTVRRKELVPLVLTFRSPVPEPLEFRLTWI